MLLQAAHPSVLDHFDEFASTLRGKRLAVFLDYDGEALPGTLHWHWQPYLMTPASQLSAQFVDAFHCNVGTLTPIVKNPDAAFMSDQVTLQI